MMHRIRKIRCLRRSRRMHGLIRFRRDEQGVQLLELAIVLPIMLLMFAGIAEFGRYFYEYTTLSKAARVGARYLVTQKVDCVQADLARNLVVYGNTAGTGSPILPVPVRGSKSVVVELPQNTRLTPVVLQLRLKPVDKGVDLTEATKRFKDGKGLVVHAIPLPK